MKTLTVAEIKAHFSDVLICVKMVKMLRFYMANQKTIAMIVPIENNPRKIGILDGKARFKIKWERQNF